MCTVSIATVQVLYIYKCINGHDQLGLRGTAEIKQHGLGRVYIYLSWVWLEQLGNTHRFGLKEKKGQHKWFYFDSENIKVQIK